MNNSWKSFGIILFIVIPAAVWAVPRFDDSKPSSTLTPLTASFPELQPIERLGECRQQLLETNSALNMVRESLFDAEQQLAKLEQDKQKLPLMIRELETRITQDHVEVINVSDQLFAVRNQLREQKNRVRQEVREFQLASQSSKESELANAQNAIDEASKSRDRQRQAIGAMPSTQDEYLHRRREKWKAAGLAEQRYYSLIAYNQRELQASIKPFQNRVDALETQSTNLNKKIDSATIQLANARDQLSKISGLIALEVSKRDQFELQLNRLEGQQRIHSEALSIASNDFTESKRQLAATQKSVQSTNLVSLATIEKPTVRHFSASQSQSASQRFNPISSFSQSKSRSNYSPTNSASRYYTPSYRPPVTKQYVSGYTRSDGTYVRGHYRTNADDSYYNNWSASGSVNPYTGSKGYRRPF